MQKLRDDPRLIVFAVFASLCGFVLGEYLGFYAKKPPFIYLLLIAIPFLILFLKKGVLPTLCFGLFLGLGILLMSLKNLAPLGEATYSGMVVEAKANYFIFQSGFHRFYVYEKDCTRELGDFLTIRGKVVPFEMTEYESRFSFSEYLGKLGVSQSLNAYDTSIRFQWPLRFRHRQLRFLSSFSEDAAGLLDSLLFDHRDYSLDLIQQASALG